MPSRRKQARIAKSVRRIRTICEFTDLFQEKSLCCRGGGEPLPYTKSKVSACSFVFQHALFHTRSVSKEMPVEQPEDGEMHGIEAVEEVLGGLAAHKAPLPVIEVQEGKGTGHAAGPAQ